MNSPVLQYCQIGHAHNQMGKHLKLKLKIVDSVQSSFMAEMEVRKYSWRRNSILDETDNMESCFLPWQKKELRNNVNNFVFTTTQPLPSLQCSFSNLKKDSELFISVVELSEFLMAIVTIASSSSEAQVTKIDKNRPTNGEVWFQIFCKITFFIRCDFSLADQQQPPTDWFLQKASRKRFELVCWTIQYQFAI